jgi:hypothetical protein
MLARAHVPYQNSTAGLPFACGHLGFHCIGNSIFKQPHFFLPQAFPEGCLQHPSYPQGHASMAGVCATVLKAGHVQSNKLNNGTIVTASDDGSRLISYAGTDADQITVNGEINKLASNIGQARNFAGVHWRSDYEWGCGSVRLWLSASCATKVTTTSARTSQASQSPHSTARRSQSRAARLTSPSQSF